MRMRNEKDKRGIRNKEEERVIYEFYGGKGGDKLHGKRKTGECERQRRELEEK